MIRIGVVGCGRIAQTMHLPYLTATEGGGVPGVKVVAVCDIIEKLAQEMGRRYHITNVYSNHRDMLKSIDLDAVAVLTSGGHTEVSVDSMNAGKHVFTEKPLCWVLEDASKIEAAQEKNDVILFVGYMKRYDPGYLRALEEFKKMKQPFLIKVHKYMPIVSYDDIKILRRIWFPSSDELVEQMRSTLTHKIIKQFGKVTSEENQAYQGMLGAFGHVLNASMGIFGLPKRVFRTDIKAQGIVVTSMLEYDDATCIYEWGGHTSSYWDEYIKAYSEGKSVRLNFTHSHVKYLPSSIIVHELGPDVSEGIELKIQVPYETAFRREWDSFVNCVEKNETPITDGKDGRKVIEVCHAIIRNYQKGEPVEISH